MGSGAEWRDAARSHRGHRLLSSVARPGPRRVAQRACRSPGAAGGGGALVPPLHRGASRLGGRAQAGPRADADPCRHPDLPHACGQGGTRGDRDLSRRADLLSFTLANTGNTYFVPENVSVKALGHDGTVLGERTVSAWYVLAGGTREFTTDVPGLSSPNAAEVVVEARCGQKVVARRLDLATRVSR